MKGVGVMPKETVRSRFSITNVRVGWMAVSDRPDVQLGIEMPNGESVIGFLYGDNCRAIGDAVPIAVEEAADAADLGARVLRIVQASNMEASRSPLSAGDARDYTEALGQGRESGSGIWMSLDRAATVRLVKVLRRALKSFDA